MNNQNFTLKSEDMELFSPFDSVWSGIVYVIAVIWFLVPLVVGIPMCLKNKVISPWYKVGWCLALLFFGMIAFFLYLVIYSRNARKE